MVSASTDSMTQGPWSDGRHMAQAAEPWAEGADADTRTVYCPY